MSHMVEFLKLILTLVVNKLSSWQSFPSRTRTSLTLVYFGGLLRSTTRCRVWTWHSNWCRFRRWNSRCWRGRSRRRNSRSRHPRVSAIGSCLARREDHLQDLVGEEEITVNSSIEKLRRATRYLCVSSWGSSRKFSRRSRKRMWLVSEGKLLKLLDKSTGLWIQNPDSQMPQSNHL